LFFHLFPQQEEATAVEVLVLNGHQHPADHVPDTHQEAHPEADMFEEVMAQATVLMVVTALMVIQADIMAAAGP
jgi:hypothetical protein